MKKKTTTNKQKRNRKGPNIREAVKYHVNKDQKHGTGNPWRSTEKKKLNSKYVFVQNSCFIKREPTRTDQQPSRTHQEATRNQPESRKNWPGNEQSIAPFIPVRDFFYEFVYIIRRNSVFTCIKRIKEVESMSSSQNFMFVSYYF